MRERSFRLCAAIVAVAAVSTLLQAIFDRHGDDGSTFVMFALVIATPIVILNRILRQRVIGSEALGFGDLTRG